MGGQSPLLSCLEDWVRDVTGAGGLAGGHLEIGGFLLSLQTSILLPSSTHLVNSKLN